MTLNPSMRRTRCGGLGPPPPSGELAVLHIELINRG
jgi:hypothetical protein